MTYKIIQANDIPDTGLVIRGNYNFFRYLSGEAGKILVKIVNPVSEGGEVILRPNQGIQVPHWRELHIFLLDQPDEGFVAIAVDPNAAFTFLLSDCDIVSDIGGSSAPISSVSVDNFPEVQQVDVVAELAQNDGTQLLYSQSGVDLPYTEFGADSNRNGVTIANNYLGTSNVPSNVASLRIQLFSLDKSTVLSTRIIYIGEDLFIKWAGEFVLQSLGSVDNAQNFSVSEFF